MGVTRSHQYGAIADRDSHSHGIAYQEPVTELSLGGATIDIDHSIVQIRSEGKRGSLDSHKSHVLLPAEHWPERYSRKDSLDNGGMRYRLVGETELSS